jgi:hypothetical protein
VADSFDDIMDESNCNGFSFDVTDLGLFIGDEGLASDGSVIPEVSEDAPVFSLLVEGIADVVTYGRDVLNACD